jgi:AhpD family alkylhydroperoxidase
MATIPPDQYRTMKKRHPEVFGETLKGQGPISEKNAHLIQLAAAAAMRSEGAVHSHSRRALDAGASAEEISHALLLLISTIGFPGVMAALSWVEDVMDKG